MGGATGLVGDPSGRSKERESFPFGTLEKNLSGLEENLQRIFLNENSISSEQAQSIRSPLRLVQNLFRFVSWCSSSEMHAFLPFTIFDIIIGAIPHPLFS